VKSLMAETPLEDELEFPAEAPPGAFREEFMLAPPQATVEPIAASSPNTEK